MGIRHFCIFTVVYYILCGVRGLEIINVSSPVKLTDIFAPNINPMYIFGGYMTYYIFAETKQQYIWYSMDYGVNNTNETSTSYFVKGDLFNSNFNQYNVTNKLPFTVAEINIPTDRFEFSTLVANGLCTSPVTNDILTCWLNVTIIYPVRMSYDIVCRLYFTKTDTFSEIIHITNSTNGVNMNEVYGGLLCFNDSYFIPYFHFDQRRPNEGEVGYGTILDLKGNIVHNSVPLANVSVANVSVANAYGVEQLITMKGGDKFNIKAINSAATDLFVLSFETINTTNNLTNTEAVFGYYTNINDTKFPIYFYNKSSIEHNSVDYQTYNTLPGITLNFNEDCCYLFGYEQDLYNNVYDVDNVYIMITDIYGNNIDIKQFPNSQDMPILYNISAYSVLPQLIDLPMISDSTTNYFMISYCVSIPPYYDYCNQSVVSVYYLQKDANNPKQYDLMNAGDFEAINVQSIYEVHEQQLDNIFVYNLPGTNQLYFSWEQDGAVQQNNTMMDVVNIYGQVFEIK